MKEHIRLCIFALLIFALLLLTRSHLAESAQMVMVDTAKLVKDFSSQKFLAGAVDVADEPE